MCKALVRRSWDLDMDIVIWSWGGGGISVKFEY